MKNKQTVNSVTVQLKDRKRKKKKKKKKKEITNDDNMGPSHRLLIMPLAIPDIKKCEAKNR